MASHSARVLVVDDDVGFGKLVAEMLSDRGFETEALGSPEQALETAASARFDVALVDLVMPGLGGLELGDRLRVLDPDLQIVILTGHSSVDAAIGGIQHRVFDFIEKSGVDGDRLERTVRSAATQNLLLRQRRELTARLSESNRLLRALHEVSATLASEPHLDRLLRQLVESAKRLCDAPRARAVLLSRPEPGDLVIDQAEGEGASSLAGMRLSAGEGLLGLTTTGTEALLVDEPRSHPRYSARCDALPADTASIVSAPVSHRQILGVLVVESGPGRLFSSAERDLVAILARQAAVAVDNARHHERTANFFAHTSELVVSLLGGADPGLAGHSRTVAALSDLVSRRLGLGETERRALHYAALFHDIGKVRLDPGLLDGPLDAAGRRAIEEHPMLGFELLRPVAEWNAVLPIVHAHHERWDGRGYPRGLEAEQIPLGARVVAVADAFDAMTRPVGPGPKRTPDEALAEIEAGAGTQFDPRVARLFVAEYRAHGDKIVG